VRTPLIVLTLLTALQPTQALTVEVTGENLHLTATAAPGTTTVKTTTVPGATLPTVDVTVDGTHVHLTLQPWTTPPLIARPENAPPVAAPTHALLRGPNPTLTLDSNTTDGTLTAQLTYTGPDGSAKVLIDETLKLTDGPVRTALLTLASSVPFTPARTVELTLTLYTAPGVTITLEYNDHRITATDGNTATTTLTYTTGTPIRITLKTEGGTHTYTLTIHPGTTGTGPRLEVTLKGPENPPHATYDLGGAYTPTGDPTTYGLRAEASVVWTVNTGKGPAPVGVLLRAEWKETGVPPTTLALPILAISEATLLKYCDQITQEAGLPALALVAPSLATALLQGKLPVLGTGVPRPRSATTLALDPLIQAWLLKRVSDALSPILPPYLTGALLASLTTTVTQDPTSAVLGALDAILPVPVAAAIDAIARATTEPLSSITTVYAGSALLAALWYALAPPIAPLAVPAALWILETAYDTLTAHPATTVTIAAVGGAPKRPTSHS